MSYLADSEQNTDFTDMRYLIVVLSILVWFSVMTPAAQACTCGGPGTPCEAYGSASAVFAGTVISSRELERPKPEDKVSWHYGRAFKFSVEQSYLGVAGIAEVEVFTGKGGGDCGVPFKVGARYLVYAYGSQDRLRTSICTRTEQFAQADEDLAFLGNLSSAAPGATIYGQIVRADSTQTEMASIISQALVTIESGNVRRQIRPAADGRYRVSGLPPGKFKVTLQLPETLTTHQAEQEIMVADRGCGSAGYLVSDNGRLSGRVLDAEGQPVARIMITLAKPESDPKNVYETMDRTDEEGRFNLSSVPAGRYVIAVNHQRYREATDPTLAYPPVFYPGVVDQPSAGVITLGAGEKVTGLDIRVPLRKPASVVSGQVVWADGTPVANASITVKEFAEGAAGSGVKADEQGRFTINGYVGRQLIVEARSNRPYVPVGTRFEPMERSEQVWITLEKPQHTIKIVITKLR